MFALACPEGIPVLTMDSVKSEETTDSSGQDETSCTPVTACDNIPEQQPSDLSQGESNDPLNSQQITAKPSTPAAKAAPSMFGNDDDDEAGTVGAAASKPPPPKQAPPAKATTSLFADDDDDPLA